MARRVGRLQHTGRRRPASEARLKTATAGERSWTDLLERIPPVPGRVVRNLVSQLSNLADRLRQRGGRRMSEAGEQRRRLFAEVEGAAVQVVRPLASWLNIASRAEVNRLYRQVDQLERRVRQRQRRQAKAKARAAVREVVESRETATTISTGDPLPDNSLAAAVLSAASVSEEISVITTPPSE